MSTHPAQVLVVDDCPDTRATLRILLGLWGHEAREAADGASALAQAASFLPDVVLLDVGLAGEDGCEVARRLRELPGLGHARLVAMTGFGRPGEVERFLRSGFDDHLLKPF